MKTYLDLEKDIREKLPELMEVSEGCYFSNLYSDQIKIIGALTEDHRDDWNCYNFDDYELEAYSNLEISKKCIIIGHEIQATHLLQFLTIKRVNYAQTADPKQIYVDNKELWIDLSKPLKDQTEELKNYLIKLL